MKTSQEEYIARLQEIQESSSVRLAMLPSDEPRFIIDSNSRSISVPEDFTFLGVLRDTGAETIYFEIDRYFDSHDLSENTCIVQFAVTNGKEILTEGIYPVTMLDVQSIDGKIIFGWTITSEVTAFKGDVTFSIRFYSLGNIEGGSGSQYIFTFCLNTLPSCLPILDSLDVTNAIANTYPALLEDWNARMQTLANYAANTLDAVNDLKNELTSSSSTTLAALNHALALAEQAQNQYDSFIENAGQQAQDLARQVVSEAYPNYQELVDTINAISTWKTSATTLLNTFEKMQNSIMTTNVYDTGNKKVDVFMHIQAQVNASKQDVMNTVSALDTTVGGVISEIEAGRAFNGTTYESMFEAMSAVMETITSYYNAAKSYAEQFATSALVSYKAFTTEIVNQLPVVGETMKFYLLEKSGGYEKYWWVLGKNGEYGWDSFGSSSTLVLNTLPATGQEDIDYIIRNGDGFVYYKWIDNDWKVVAGSLIVLCEAGTDDDGNPIDGALPETGNELSDYYVETAGGAYKHYRWINGSYALVGADVIDRLEDVESTLNENTSDISQAKTDILNLNNAATNLQQQVNNLDLSGNVYDMELSVDEESGNNVLTLIENDTPKSTITLPSGGGSGSGSGSSSAVILTVEKVTQSPLVVTPSDDVKLTVNMSAVDGDGETVDCTYVLKMGNNIIKSGVMAQGTNTFDIKDNVTIGTQKFTLVVTAEGGSMSIKNWTVQKVDVRIESSFNDKNVITIGRSASFTYMPYGALSKTVHFILDGVEMTPVVTTASGISQSYTIPAQTHGAHLLECYITALINNTLVETEHIFKDIIWYDSSSDVPVIGCIYRNDHYGTVNAKQYDSTSIPYVVYDPSTNNPHVSLKIDGEVYSNLTLTDAYNVWIYKTESVGTHNLSIKCGDTTVPIVFDIAELGIDISQITANLEFDFNPNGLSNSSANRVWQDSNTDVAMTVSSNFDWNNGGYQIDSDGNQYFCVKAGTSIDISHKMFEEDPTVYGEEFKIIFKTTNVRKADATFLRCLETVTSEVDGEQVSTVVGFKMNVHEAYLYNNSATLYMPYSEEDVIEFEWNINTIDKDNPDASSLIMSYEDGVGYRPMIYSNGTRMFQYAPDTIHIGSDDCDVHIYRMKVYSTSLNDSEILNNFIADALNADTMIARYNRNRIYNENNDLTPDSVAEACPNLRVIKIECPHFTNDKKNFVRDTSIECIYKNGDPVLDNWKFINCYHAGQGTTSNEYGYAARNIDVLCCFDGIHAANDKIALDPTYKTELTLGDGTKYTDGSGKVSLTRNSVPNNWFNLKVNVASSEMANNALLQKRFNDFLPYITPAQLRDSRCKNDMEFVNCVVFIKENDPDITTHREFTDNDWHFYSLANIGDSKKTDYTRAYDQTDLREFTVEISDNTKKNAAFQTGVEKAGGGVKYPIELGEWNAATNESRLALYNDWDGSFEFRYDCCGDSKDGAAITSSEALDAQRAKNRQVWRAFYEWVIMSTDEQFVAEFEDWCVEKSMLYWYLFTERYIMIDNRAKNTFWHFAKTGTYRAIKRPVKSMLHVYCEKDASNQYVATADTDIISGKTYYSQHAFDMWDYDNDTSLGINNSGELTMTYGKEDIDYKTDGVPSSGYIFNAAESVFWCRIRDLMPAKLNTLYQSINPNCWSASHLINEFDEWQAQFPEELWRLHIQRVYYRTYQGGGLDGGKQPTPTERFMKSMMQGRKKYQRRQFERDQEAYCGTKHLTSDVRADQIMFRCNTPVGSDVVVAPDYTLKIVPYSDIYLSVLFGNGATPTQIRAKAGQEYVIECTEETMDDTAVLIYCASRIQSLNDLSSCYIHDNDFSKATRLRTLKIGSNIQGYANSFLENLNLGKNELLETLDIRNCPKLTGLINLASCGNLVNFYASGTIITGVTFANNGKIKNAYLPTTLRSLVMRNLLQLTNLNVLSYNSLESLTIDIKVDDDGTTHDIVDSLSIVQATGSSLQTVRLTGIDWVLTNTELLNELVSKYSTILSGKVYVSGTIRNREIAAYSAAWPDLEISYDADNLIDQYTLTFKNYDGTVLCTQYVDRGSNAYNPVDPDGDGDYSDGEIEVPTKPPIAAETYAFSGWDSSLNKILSDKTIFASYTATPRTYTVTWCSQVGVVLETQTVTYGSCATYSGNIPTRNDREGESIYYLFEGWDKSTGYIKENTTVFAKWQSGTLPDSADEISIGEMNEAQIYGMVKEKRSYAFVGLKDEINVNVGYAPIFSNVAYKDLISEETVFDGTESTIVHTGEYPMAEDSGWTLVTDFMFTASTAGAALVSCWDSTSSDGFQIRYNGGASARWGNLSTANALGNTNQRQIVVLRHKPNDNNLYVYWSNISARGEISTTQNRQVVSFSRAQATNFELIFGAQGVYGGYYEATAAGKVFYSRLYKDDIGEAECLKMANWPIQTYTFQAYGYVPTGQANGKNNVAYSNYTLSGSSERGSVDFISKDLLTWTYQMNTSNTNVGGWDKSIMRPWLNNRFFPALPITWQQILKQVKVVSNVGGGSSSAPSNGIQSSDDYIRIPCITEMNNTSSDPYGLEGKYIPWFTSDATRVKYMDNGKGSAGAYWLRSPSVTGSTNFWNVGSYGGCGNGYYASYSYGAAPCFTI